MITLDRVNPFKYTKQKLKLPYDASTPGYEFRLVMLLSDHKDASSILNQDSYRVATTYKRYYRPYKVRQKFFTKIVQTRLDQTQMSDMATFCKNELNMLYLPKPNVIKNRNIVVDTSDFHKNFVSHIGNRSYKLVATNYVSMLKEFITLSMVGSKHKNNYILIDAANWDISGANKKDVVNMSSKLINPLSIIYFLLRKNFTLLKDTLGDYTFLIFDGTMGWFHFKVSDIDKRTHLAFAKEVRKFRNASAMIDHVDTLNDEGELPENEQEKIPDEVMSGMQQLDDLSDEVLDTKTKEELRKELLNSIKGATKGSVPKELIADDTDAEVPDINVDDNIDDDDEDEESPVDIDNNIDETSVDLNIYDDQELDEEIAAASVELNYDKMDRAMSKNSAREAELRKRQKEITLDGIKLGTLKVDMPDTEIKTNNVTKKVFTTNENVKEIRFDNFNKSYNEKLMQKDILNVFKSLNDKPIPVYITSISKEDTSTAMDLKETYTVKLEDANRVRHSLTIDIPKIYDENYMYLGGNRKQLVNQLLQKPIVKIKPDTVQIRTDFKKVFMYRRGDNVSPKIDLFKKIILSPDNAKYFKVRRGDGTALNGSTKTTIEYDSIAKDVLELQVRKFPLTLRFDQLGYTDQVKHGLIPAPKDGNELRIGKVGNELITVNADGNADTNSSDSIIDIFVEYFNDKMKMDFWSLAKGAKASKQFMYTYCMIMAKKIPTIILLGYYEGLTTILRKANIEFRFSDTQPKGLVKSEGYIQFADGYLIYKREPIQSSLLLNGLAIFDTVAYKFSDFDTKAPYLDIIESQTGMRSTASGYDSFYDNMIDPITKQILQQMGYPTDFVGLLIAANTLLADNSYHSEIDMSQFRVRNNEIIAAVLYSVVSEAYTKYRRTAMNRNPMKISVPKNAVIKEIMALNTLEDYSIINPITEKEKLRSISAKGHFGINMDKAYTQEKRSFDKSMTGLMAISTSPDANCGVVRELTIEPKIMDSRGFIDVDKSNDDINDANMFSYAEALTPLGVTRDDSIRTAMATKQSKHIIPVADMSPVLISSGIEKTLPYTVSKDFAIKAEDNGVVESFDKATGMMIVKYNNGKHEAINLNPVVVKNGAGGFYLSNKLDAKFQVGDKFSKNDIIAINDTFFGDNFDGPKFNIGTLCKVACLSSFGTFEDSKLVTEQLSHRLSTEMVMCKHITLGPNANVDHIVKKGQAIEVGDTLINYEQSNSDEAMNDLLSSIGQDLGEEIKNLGKSKLKSKYTGVIEDVRIYCTEELDNLSPSLRAIVEPYWKEIGKKKALVKKYKITDPSYSGNTFYEMDRPITPNADGKVKGYSIDKGVIIEFFIKFNDPVGVGDKVVDFAALKGVVSGIIPKGQEPYTVDYPDEEISTIFPANSVLSRKVPSILITMFGNKMIVGLTQRLKEIYFDKK